MVVLEDVPRGGSTSLRSFHRASGTRAPGETSPSGAAIRPGSTIMKTRPPQLKVSNPAIQKARKLPPFKAAPRR